MRCLVCGKQIGSIRCLFDRKYCCDRHRKIARTLSARAIRDVRVYDDLEEPWLVTPGLPEEQKRSSGTGFGPAAGVLLTVLIIFVVLLAPPGQHRSPAARRTAPSLSVMERVKKLLPGAPTFDIRYDFSNDLDEWVGGLAEGGRGWIRQSGKVRLGELRLWKPTLSMADYQMMFQGQIESRAMGWTFRASGTDNYYAAKLTVPEANARGRAEIVRYTVVNGRASERVQLPIPIHLEPHVAYKIRVRVKENRFTTTVNGQVVDVFTDERHKKGGVGFFADPGEEALISWVRINNAEGLFDRLLSMTLLIGPRELMQAGLP